MTFQPVLPISGYAGWRFLERTLDNQRAAFNDNPQIQRGTEAFRDRINAVRTAQDLVEDRELLSVALGAFGLDGDLNNRFFVRKILEEGTTQPDALANRLADSRYREFAAAFGFGADTVPRTQFSFFADEIIDRYEAKQFERAVGEKDNNLRLALNLDPALSEVVESSASETAQWFGLMGNPPLRTLFETALGFPASFSNLDLDRQLDQFRSRSEATFGTSSLSDFADGDKQEELIRLYLIRSEAQNSGIVAGSSVALTLLQNAQAYTL